MAFSARILIAAVFFPISMAHAGLLAVGPWPNDSSFPPMDLFSVSSTTGLPTSIGSTGIARLQGLTLGPSGNLLSTNGPRLYSIDPNNGATTELVTLPFNSIEGGIAHQPGTDNVFVVNSGVVAAEGLYLYDLANNTGGFVGGFGFASDRDISGAAFDSNGILHILHSGVTLATNTLLIATVDPNTGTATDVLNTGIANSGVAGLAFNGAGTGFFTNGNELYSFDVGNSTTNLVGASGLSGRLSGLVFVQQTTVIPEPSAFALFAMGSLCLVRSRRRKALRAA